jgi:hypothetical protein
MPPAHPRCFLGLKAAFPVAGMVTVSGFGESTGHDHRLVREMPKYRHFPAQLTTTSVNRLWILVKVMIANWGRCVPNMGLSAPNQ